MKPWRGRGIRVPASARILNGSHGWPGRHDTPFDERPEQTGAGFDYLTRVFVGSLH